MQLIGFIKKLDKYINHICFAPKKSKWVFVIVMLILSFIYNYHEVIFLRPQGIHQWRQCDCLSITMNYYQNDNSFFKPSIHYLGGDGSGKTISEFPVIYYFVAILWKIFGCHEFIFRIINLIIIFSGLFALFKLLEDVLKDTIWAVSVVALLFTSPMLVYYANNFLVNVPAFGFVLIAWFFLWKFYKNEKIKNLYISFFFFTIGGLLKITSSISFIAITIIFLFELFSIYSFKNGGKIFRYPQRQILPFLCVILVLLIWYFYAHNYNEKYNRGLFLIGILPIWDLDTQQIHKILLAVKEHIKWSYFREGVHLILGTLFFLILIYYKKVNKFLLFLMILISLGFFSFLILFFQAMESHDYYIINLLILMPIISLTFLLTLKNIHYKMFKSVIFRIIIIAFIIHNVDFARRRMNGRYSGWMNENHLKYTQAFETLTPYIRSLGIKKEDKVICLPDNSVNITLYLMNQKGWTNFGDLTDSIKIINKINRGAKYLFIYDKELYKKKSIQPFIINRMGKYKNIDIYSLENINIK